MRRTVWRFGALRCDSAYVLFSPAVCCDSAGNCASRTWGSTGRWPRWRSGDACTGVNRRLPAFQFRSEHEKEWMSILECNISDTIVLMLHYEIEIGRRSSKELSFQVLSVSQGMLLCSLHTIEFWYGRQGAVVWKWNYWSVHGFSAHWSDAPHQACLTSQNPQPDIFASMTLRTCRWFAVKW